MPERRVVYVVGAGLSAGLGFPTVSNLLPELWKRLEKAALDVDLASVVRFHHPEFNPSLPDSYPNIEQLLSEMQANAQLFDSSRPATGNFTSEELERRRQGLLLELARWFHDLQAKALKKNPSWLSALVERMLAEEAQIISFNWDLVLDETLFGANLDKASYGFGGKRSGVRLLKPHGSLNWYQTPKAKFLKLDKRFPLLSGDGRPVFAFRPYREPKSERNVYMPLIVPPVYMKEFKGDLFKVLWREAVSVLSTASEVRFLGYSLPAADFHARFILRCGFHNQEFGELLEDGSRAPATGRSRVIIVDPVCDGSIRIEKAVGWKCKHRKMKIAKWMSARK